MIYLLFIVPTYSVQKNSSRCKGSDDKTEYRGKVRSLATCAALCNGVSKYFSMAKHYEVSNRKCSPHAGLHLCECYCEVGDTCEAETDEDFDAFAFDRYGLVLGDIKKIRSALIVDRSIFLSDTVLFKTQIFSI